MLLLPLDAFKFLNAMTPLWSHKVGEKAVIFLTNPRQHFTYIFNEYLGEFTLFLLWFIDHKSVVYYTLKTFMIQKELDAFSYEQFIFKCKCWFGLYYIQASQGSSAGPYSWLSAKKIWPDEQKLPGKEDSGAVCCTAWDIRSSFILHVYQRVFCAVNLYLAFEVSASVLCWWQHSHHLFMPAL